MAKERKPVDALMEKDLDAFLNKFGALEDFNSGKIKCKFCRQAMNKENIYSLFLESGSVKMVCDQHECLSAFFEYMNEKNKRKSEE